MFLHEKLILWLTALLLARVNSTVLFFHNNSASRIARSALFSMSVCNECTRRDIIFARARQLRERPAAS